MNIPSSSNNFALCFHRYRLRFVLRIIFSTIVVAWIVGEWPISANALTLEYRCLATTNAVFRIASKTAKKMNSWPWVKIIESKQTIKTVVRNWRNFGIPVWIQVNEVEPEKDSTQTAINIHWEQTLDPLNYPDLLYFLEAFDNDQRKEKLGCQRSGTDIGL